MATDKIRTFCKEIQYYYKRRGRDLPWRHTRDPYKILVSEIMLQQTQVERVLRFWSPFIKQFPNFRAIRRAPLKLVLGAWQGLGYNRRALYLKKIAEAIEKKYHGVLPRNPAILKTLPGVGDATAGALTAFAYNHATPFIETNIRRVFIHFFFPSKKKVNDEEIHTLVAQTIDRKNPREWYYALMDYGAMLGARMRENPNRRSSRYRKQSRFRGSDRELRGKILHTLLTKKPISPETLQENIKEDGHRIKKILKTLEKEGLIGRKGKGISP